jgi:SAM-dependent methyltransferase
MTGADMSDDPYGEATAEFYDLLAAGMWDTFGPALGRLLADVDPSNGPIVDLGAGTGIGTVHIHAAVPAARIVAIEPSKAMRAVLHTRLAQHPDLLRLVTVVPFGIEDAALPESISGLVASAVLGHLDTPTREGLWRTLAERLAPGAPAVIGVLPPARPEQVPPTRYRELAVGEHVYEGWMQGDVVDERRMRWTMTYRVKSGEHTVYERAAQSEWITSDADDVAAEIAPFGLVMERPGDECVVIRRPA